MVIYDLHLCVMVNLPQVPVSLKSVRSVLMWAPFVPICLHHVVCICCVNLSAYALCEHGSY